MALLLATGGCALLLYAVLHDIAARTIPDAVPAALLALGAVSHALDGRLVSCLACAVAVGAVAALAWRSGWLGGGDVKLLAAVSAFGVPAGVPVLLAYVALAGGGLALVYLALGWALRLRGVRPGKVPAGLPARVLRAEAWRIRRSAPLPYAAAITAGTFMSLARH